MLMMVMMLSLWHDDYHRSILCTRLPSSKVDTSVRDTLKPQ